MSPQWTNFVLPSNIPNGKLEILVLDCLNIETCRQENKTQLPRYYKLQTTFFTIFKQKLVKNLTAMNQS